MNALAAALLVIASLPATAQGPARQEGVLPLLQATADGPICLIDAPPGTYRIEATYAGAVRKARTTITKAGGPPRRLVFAFPEEPWDGIRASPEEKRQAAQP